MPGSHYATLEGCMIPTAVSTPWDHTYVESSCGFRWGCFGANTGGSVIASGSGDSFIADCLSQPNATAAIRYGITGVCHQAANRILHPAGGITVALASGYARSFAAYGTYGLLAWPANKSCYTRSGPGASSTVKVRRNPQTVSARGSELMQAYHEAVAQVVDAAPGARADAEFLEMKRLYEMKLGGSLDDDRARASFLVQSELRTLQAFLVRRLDDGDLTPQDYLERFEDLLTASMIQNRVLFGLSDFELIFGKGGAGCDGILDRSRFGEAPSMTSA